MLVFYVDSTPKQWCAVAEKIMINIEKLSFYYKKNKPLFQGLDLSLNEGHIYGLLGKNGAGKTSLLKVVTGLVFPASGEVAVNGFKPKDRQPNFLSDIYFIHEEFYAPKLSIKAYVNLYAPFYPKFDHPYFNDILDQFGLNQSLMLTDLSYGQKKKFFITFGLASRTRVLVLDEPTNGLDIPSKSLFRKMIAAHADEETLIVVSTHQVRDVENLIDSVILLDEGEIVFNQSFESISKTLAFDKQEKEPDTAACFYSEPSIQGYSVVKKNEGQHESKVDLELLFNAIMASKTKIKALFKESSNDKK